MGRRILTDIDEGLYCTDCKQIVTYFRSSPIANSPADGPPIRSHLSTIQYCTVLCATVILCSNPLHLFVVADIIPTFFTHLHSVRIQT